MAAQLHAPIRAYVREVRAISYRDVRGRQRGPYASIGYGAGGITYLLWFLGVRRNDRALLLDARRWFRSLRRARGKDAFCADFVKPEYVEQSIVNGYAGHHLLGALIGHSLDDLSLRERHLGEFLAICRRTDRPPELLHGDAGFLIGALLLERHTGDPRLAPIADQLAARLLAVEWKRHGFAHGTAGVLHALVQWVGARGGAGPARLRERLAAMPRGLGGPPPSFVPTWCNGAGGHVLLWAGAYRTLGDPVYLERAEEAAAWMCAPAEKTLGTLCCGEGGVAYALLALDRARPSPELRARAAARAARAIAQLDSPWPNSLMHGFAGLACLAEDLERGGGGFPLCEL
ncbi:MAG TPA: lanthionine synthetase LanC family protein [Kofleriaceae bacterium]|nr:lanthionine synthetase LanC family protein [Kofleriaceae bacterium]